MSKIDFSKKQALIVTANEEIVETLLSKNTNNRSIRKRNKEWLKNAIDKKEFILTGQGIGVSTDGVLVDGQHRLEALREAGYPPVELLVITGLDPKSMMYVDQHAKRSTADMLKIVLDKSITNREASLVNAHIKIGTNDEGDFVFAKGRISSDQVVEVMQENEDFISQLISAGGNTLRAASYCALFHYGLKFDKDRAISLAAKIHTGENLNRNDPAYKMRELLMSSHRKTTYGSAGQLADYKYGVSACISDALNEGLSVLRQASSWDRLPKKLARSFVKSA